MSSKSDLRVNIEKAIAAGSILGIASILQLVFNVIVSRQLGAEIAGVFFISFNIVMLFAIVAQLGMDLSLVRLISPLWSQKSYNKFRQIRSSAVKLSLLSALIVSAFLFTSASFLAESVFDEVRLKSTLQYSIIAIVPLSLGLVYSSILRAQKNTTKSLIVKHISLYAPAIGIVSVVSTIHSVAFGLVAGATSTAIVGYLLVRQSTIKKEKPSHAKKIYPYTTSTLLKVSFPFLIIVLSSRLMNWMDTFMLGALTDTQSVALYNAGLQISIGISLILTAFNTISAAQFSDLYGQNKIQQLNDLYRKVTRIILAISIPVTIAVIVFSTPLLSLFGSEFTEAKTALIILALGQLINTGVGSVGYLDSMTGGESHLAKVSLLVNILNILLNIVLIPSFGIIGAATATATSLAIKNIILAISVRKRLGISIL